MDDTDFRAVRASYARVESGCPFCEIGERPVVLQNQLALVLKDLYPVSKGTFSSSLGCHVGDDLDLGMPEARACHVLLSEARALVLANDSSVSGFNVGVNAGTAAGQTVMHCHIHLIPRRNGDILIPGAVFGA